ncbi:MAG: IclR family transcriptional regulator [Atopobiaceae bacterium]|jgi:DNA-binding IclR family transcriptional regulator|nr:IclR family transcriptional regulator [Atopobiaceae bacterium]
MPKDDAGRGVEHRSTLRVLTILRLLARHEGGMTLSELGREVGAPKSSIYPIIHTMADQGFVELDEASARYSIGLKSYLVGMSYDSGGRAMRVVTDAMRSVVDACNETCQLGVLEDGRALYVAKVDSTEAISLKSDVGKSLPLYCTAIGKALVSEMPLDEVRKLVGDRFERITKTTITSFDQLARQLEQVRESGIAHDGGEITEEVDCLAVPIKVRGEVVYGMSVSVPSFRFTREKEQMVREILMDTRDRLERTLS